MPPTTSPSYRNASTTRRHGAAIEALLLVAEHGGDTMLPRIGIMRALNAGEPALTPRKKLAIRSRA